MAVPTDFSGLITWADFSDASSIFEDTARTDAAEVDDLIAGVTDKSPAGNHLTQATSGNRPTWRAKVQNGLAAAQFDGTNDWLGNSVTDTQPFTFLYVGSNEWVSGDRTIFESTGAVLSHYYHNGNAFHIHAGSVLNAGPRTDPSWHAYRCVYNGATSQMWEDRRLRIEGNASTNNIVTGMRLGTNAGASNFHKGYVGDWMLYDRLLTADEADQLDDYLLDKWSIVPGLRADDSKFPRAKLRKKVLV